MNPFKGRFFQRNIILWVVQLVLQIRHQLLELQRMLVNVALMLTLPLVAAF